MEFNYDVVIIGSGPGGYVAAIRCAQLGLKTAIVEKEKTFGGTCLNVGCIPSKALLDSSELYSLTANKMKENGISFSKIGIDLVQMMNRKEQVVEKMTSGVALLLKNHKVETFAGWGKLKDDHTVSVEKADGTIELKSKNIILATGSAPMELPALPFDGEKIVDSTGALSFRQIPRKLAVIGAGAIGLEIGSIWSRLGSEVTVIEMMDQILPQSDPYSSSRLMQMLKKQGLNFKLSTVVQSAGIENSKIKLALRETDNSQSVLICDKLLVAAGRKPLTKNIGLEETGVRTDPSGRITINNRFQTSVPNIYAIGDLIAGPMLAHKASEEGIAAAEIIAGGYGTVHYQALPSIVYTWPEYAAVGMGESELNKNGISFKSGVFQFRANGRSLAAGEDDGFVKIFADTDTDRLLGARIIGPWASDLIMEAVMVMEFNGNSEDLARSIHAHPTLSEVVKEAAMDASNWSIHSLPKVLKKR